MDGNNDVRFLASEEAFREVSSKITQNAKLRVKEGLGNIYESLEENNIYSDFTSEELRNSAAEKFAFATELLLKGDILYDDFRRNFRFNQLSPLYTGEFRQIGGSMQEKIYYSVGSEEWKKSLSGDDWFLSQLPDPKEIRKIILENDPDDERKILTNDPAYNESLRTLTKDGSRPTGHSLYAYYQLQGPIAKSLINSEIYCYVTEEIQYTIIALLTDDTIKTDISGNTKLPKNIMEKLDELKDKSVKLRYSSVSNNNINVLDLNFLRDFAISTLNVAEFRFPIPKRYKSMEFNRYRYDNFKNNGLVEFDFLDKVSKYYLQKYFGVDEINKFKDYIKLLKNVNIPEIEIRKFICNSIYFKTYIITKMDINIFFTEKQFARIYALCDSLKSFKPFDPNSKKLCDTISDDKRIEYIEKAKILMDSRYKENIKLFTDEILRCNKESDIFKMLDSEEYRTYPSLFTPERLSRYNVNTILEVANILRNNGVIVNSSRFSKGKKYKINRDIAAISLNEKTDLVDLDAVTLNFKDASSISGGVYKGNDLFIQYTYGGKLKKCQFYIVIQKDIWI